MTKILGLDLGTNSIGWAVVGTEDNKNFELIDKGVRIFQEGVKIEKGVESSKAAERTAYRSARRIKYRRKLRKIATLKILSKYGYCPQLSTQELNNWRYEKSYPVNKTFLDWQKTDEETGKNPYRYRAMAIETELDLSNEEDRFKLGRAFYHMSQRRGFLSNRLDANKESDGAVQKEINEINEAKGELTLGQYFFKLYKKGQKIRSHYTHREQHYHDEFNRICDFQNLPEEFTTELRKAIFYQRPLKSQKGLVGKCPFEKNKSRCPVSHPMFEEYRMYSFINNIRIKSPYDEKLRFLNSEEKELIKPLFLRKSKEHFNFEEIAKRLTPKGWPYKFHKSREISPNDYLFNFSMKTPVSGCRTISLLKEIFGDYWHDGITETYKLNEQKSGKKSTDEMVNDIWHVLFSFDKTEKLLEFAKSKLELSEELATKFSKITLKQDYASLSLKAIRKILPYLKEGLTYSHAIFMAKLEDIVPPEIWKNIENQQYIRNEIQNIIKSQNKESQLNDIVNSIIKINREQKAYWSENEHWQKALKSDIEKKLIAFTGKNKWKDFVEDKRIQLKEDVFSRVKKQMGNNLGKGEFIKTDRIDERVKTFLADNFNITEKNIEKLYHPSAVEVYKAAKKAQDGNYYLGSPMISSVRNPMAMRALHQLRKVINELIKENIIDHDTKINIEMARDLKNANERIAWQRWQRERHNEHERIKEQIRNDYKAASGKEIEPTENEILKYQLWEEQNHICLYTGKSIGVCDFIGKNPKFDIEHTIPRSLSFDNSQENLTLCESKYNRETKRNKIPTDLPDHEQILARIEHWHERVQELNKNVDNARFTSKRAADKQAKDSAIQRRHKFEIDLKYWQNKYKRFVMKDVPEGFKNSQLIDTGIITKYARLYLQTVFSKVYTVKGNTVADFRKMWGIQTEYEKKQRVNHVHHCIDAITIACMSKDNYEELAKFYHEWEQFKRAETDDKPHFPKPWPTFTENMKEVENEILVSHYTPDNLPKKAKKALRIRGKIQKNKTGNPVYQKGDSIRGSLHKETNYGAIKISNRDDKTGKTKEEIKYVVRKPLDSVTASDIKNIVDNNIRQIVEDGKKEESKLKKQLELAEKELRDVENIEQQDSLKAEIEKIKAEISELFAIKNKNGSITPIKKVRCFAHVSEPLKIKLHRDKDKSPDHKKHSYYVNDSNYAMAIYEGTDKNGVLKRSFKIVNNLDAGLYFLNKTEENPIPEIHPKTKHQFKYHIKTGTLVVFWNNSSGELENLELDEKKKRLYKVTKMSKDGRITFKFHQEARNDEKLKSDFENQNGIKPPKSLTNGESYINFNTPFPKLLLSPSKFNMLVEGYDFKISPLGKIRRIEESAKSNHTNSKKPHRFKF